MNDRDRMLAEGPRVAPEPPLADGTPLTPAQPSGRGPTDRARTVSWPVRRLLPFAFFGVVVAANAGLGKYALWVLVPIALAAFLVQRRRRASK